MTRRAKGFTLIEVLIAAGITATVTVLVWGAFRNTFNTKTRVENAAQRYRTVRLAVDRIAAELSMAYLSQNEDTSQQERRTLFVAKGNRNMSEVRFVYFGHQRLYQDAHEADTAQLQYLVLPDTHDRSRYNLVRRESRRLQYAKIDDMAHEGEIICDDVVRFTLEFWDARDGRDTHLSKWKQEWNTTSADGQPDRLPARVRITLAVRDERGQEVPFITDARLMIQEPLNLRANDVAMTPPTGAPATPPTGGNTPAVNPIQPPGLMR